MRLFIAIIFTLLSTSCATNNSWHWEKSGASQQDFNMDQGQCNAQAFANPGSSLLQVAIIQNQCLIGKGWRQIQNTPSASTQSTKVTAWGDCSFDFDCANGLTCKPLTALRPNGSKVCRKPEIQ